VAPAAAPDSDVTRFRAFGAAAAVLVLTVIAAIALRSGPSALVTPGPLARPHQGLACASCHEEAHDGRAASACSGCHGAHASVRPAHAALARDGEFGCADCHAVHRAESGLAFEPNGTVAHYGTGFERALGASVVGVPSRSERATFVPLIARAACERCHELDRATDPAWACFGGSERVAPGEYAVCFDEHRRPAERSPARSAERDAAVERARELAPRLPRERTQNLAAGSATVALGAFAAGLVIVVARRRSKRKIRVKSLPLVLQPPGARRLPVIDVGRCLGCQACVDACPYDVLEMSRYVAVVTRPEQCCGAGPCLSACPNGSLTLRDGPELPDVPRLSSHFESLDRPGIFLVGDLTGGSLIRRALEQGVAAARAVAGDLRASRMSPLDPRARRPKADGGEGSPVDLVVVGAGPAGLAAGLEAERTGLSVIVLEQASLAESIRRFSRDKLVLDAQSAGEADLPLWIGDCTKDELLRRWLREVRARGLDVREGVRVLGIDSQPRAAFRVRAIGPGGVGIATSGRRVVLATGRRGSPRRLEAKPPDAALGRVHYELSDARAFAGSRVVVVGLGDVAMETAIALSLQSGTTVTLVHRGRGFSRGRQKNVETIGRLVAEGRIGLLFEAEVRRIGMDGLVVEAEGHERSIPYDAIFVHIGAEARTGLWPLANGQIRLMSNEEWDS
jgi:thioredoxin reductase/NAD-dependent dihydropyrimidine dehydrogenase PreA subunit